MDAFNSQATNAMWALNPHIVNASFTISPFDGKRINRRFMPGGLLSTQQGMKTKTPTSVMLTTLYVSAAIPT